MVYNALMRNLFHEIFKNVAKIFSGQNLAWHFLAIALTYALVMAGFDWKYFELTRGPELQALLWPAVEVGAFVPMFGILLLLAASWLAEKKKLVFTAFALGQAAALGWLVSEAYKFFTGRPGPPHGIGANIAVDTSHIFRFGLGRGGIFFGWPSSHTMIAFAMAAALFVLFPKSKTIKILSAAYAIYIGIGVSATIHWFSDFVAGAIIGMVIGTVVGKSFAKLQSF